MGKKAKQRANHSRDVTRSLLVINTTCGDRQHVIRTHRLQLLSRESAISNPRLPSLCFIKSTACKVSRSLVKVEDSINDEACELVNGVEISIGEGDDSILDYLFTAVKNNNGIDILLLSDILGFEGSSTRDFAYRVACNGYNVLVSDLFRGDPWAQDRPKTLFEEWLAQQTLERIAKDITTSKNWMMDEFVVAGISKKLGIIGFCFGGGRVIDALAQDGGACFGVGVLFYGTRIDPSVVANIKVTVLFIVGDNDLSCPVSALVYDFLNVNFDVDVDVLYFRKY
ncbi:hypothetical protein ACSBR2_018733 [Camellia fascicularis]